MNLGKKIINLRKRDKITQEGLAELIGVTRQTISNWELNVTKPDITQIKEISKIFHVSIDELLESDIKNIFIEKVNKTEKIVSKNTRNIRILVTTIYFIILLSIIFLTIYLLTKKDFTTKYQSEFTCASEEITYNIAVEEEQSTDTTNTKEYFIVVSELDKEQNAYYVMEKYYTGKTYTEVFNELTTIKKVLIDQYNTKCR